MKLALLGHPIAHSLSPSLYREILGTKLESYELLDIEDPSLIPDIFELQSKYDGLSITSPHKKHFFQNVIINSPIVRELKAINTISFRKSGIYGTNTDVLAVEKILLGFKEQLPNLELIILGDGVMARLTKMVAISQNILFKQYSRNKGDDLTHLNLSSPPASPTIVINSCSRNFIFSGSLHPSLIFWDYNYSFKPHQNTLPSQVKAYIDGEEMLRLQALAAIDFWSAT
jgi:shikimate 5-dehydrogenase